MTSHHPIALAAALSVTWPAAAQSPDEVLATRRFESGVEFARDANYEQALADFSAVLELYPTSGVADNAVLAMAHYYLEVAGDIPRAVEAADRIVGDAAYSQTDAAPDAYIILGRAAMARGRTEDDLRDALSSFQRGLRLHPDAPAVPEARYYIGEVQRRSGRLAEALATFRQVVTEHPRDPWAVRARLGVGTLLAFLGDPVSAMEQYQIVRDDNPDGPEAGEALARTTILFRLYMRPRGATYTVLPASDPGRRIERKVIALASANDGNVVIATERGLAMLRQTNAMPPLATRPRGLGVDRDGTVVALERASLLRRGAPPVPLAVTEDGESRSVGEIDALVVTSNGDWLVADRERRAVQRFTHDGTYLGRYAGVRATRLAIDPDDRVAVLDDDDRILVYEEGEQIGEIATRTDEYRIDNPVDLAFDGFGHLYVLDREGIYIFDRGQRLLTWFPGAASAAAVFERATALAIDRFGRLYVADERDKLIYGFQ